MIARPATYFAISVLIAASGSSLVVAQPAADSPRTPDPESLERWQAMRFGMFIHWGPVSLKGTEIGWSRGREVPEQEYDQLFRQFNPTQFDANAWTQLARDAGMKYLVITSKHHDGFCIWDSPSTDYDIMATPFGRDVLKELSESCRRHDLLFCTYHSICDWWHPDYPTGSPGGSTEKPNPNMERYVEYLHGQVQELIENYGPLGILWFDGEWEAPWTHQHGLALYDHVRSLQPDILINNRVDKGREDMKGTTSSAEFVGDYDTPEQRVGGFNRQRPWETCMTIGRQWSWKPNDNMKSLSECIHTLIQTVGGDGNLLLNVGPMPDGRIEPRQADRLREMGAWLKQYGEGIYGTRGGPFRPGPWGAATCKEDRIYLFVTSWPAEGPLHLPPLGASILAARRLGDGDVKVEQTDEGITIDASPRDPIATVLVLTLNQSAVAIPPLP